MWPGWGFVAEDPDFADRVVGEGLRFLGPSGATIRKIGDKIAAKRLAQRAGIPVAAWSGGEVADADAALLHARDLGYPLVIKAVAGGGGRGIPHGQLRGRTRAGLSSRHGRSHRRLW